MAISWKIMNIEWHSKSTIQTLPLQRVPSDVHELTVIERVSTEISDTTISGSLHMDALFRPHHTDVLFQLHAKPWISLTTVALFCPPTEHWISPNELLEYALNSGSSNCFTAACNSQGARSCPFYMTTLEYQLEYFYNEFTTKALKYKLFTAIYKAIYKVENFK